MRQALLISVAAIALAAGSTIALSQGGGQSGGAAGGASVGAPGGGAQGGGAINANPSGPSGGANGAAKGSPGTITENPAPGPSRTTQDNRTAPNPNAPSAQAPAEKQGAPLQRSEGGGKQDQRQSESPQGKQDRSAQQPSGDNKQGAQTGTDGGSKQGSAKGSGEMRSSNVSLTTEQKTTVRNTVINTGPKITNVNFDISVGTVVPRSVRVAPVPATLVSIEPSWRGHMYFIYDDEIIIVDARTLKIVAVIEV